MNTIIVYNWALQSTSRGSTPEDQLFRLLDSASNEIKILNKSLIYFELLSVGQAIAKSDDIARFLQSNRPC
jgi:hypothetical protein